LTHADAYHIRFRKVLEAIDAHLDEDLSVERLSSVAAFSKFHFHRQFSELYGVGVSRYVQLVRLKRASYQLAFHRRLRILEIALACGYESHEAFSRAFKKVFGQTPSEFREQPRWESWHATYQPLRELRSQHMKPESPAPEVRIVQFAPTRVALLVHRGDPRLVGNSIRDFIAWRKQNQLPPRLSATYNIHYDNPHDTPAEQFRLGLCAATDRAVAENPYGVVEHVIPAGRCAVLRHIGTDDHLGASIRFLYQSWLPSSGEELRDYPLFGQRLSFFPDVPEHEATSDLFLPLA
jgi:AraC family transcriptional regulator